MRFLLSISLFLTVINTCFSQTFSARLVNTGVITAGEVASEETSIATATFQLTTAAGNPAATALAYEVSLDAFDLDGTKTTDLGDDVTAVHLHTLDECAAATCVPGDTAGTTHVLNIFGVPREDDADLLVDLAASTVSGVWDPSDVNSLSPAPGLDPNDFLDELAAGRLFIMVHTRDFSGGAVGGILVPEPSALSLIWPVAVVTSVRRRKRTRAF